MKKSLSFILSLSFFTSIALGQQVEKCATMHVLQKHKEQDPSIAIRMKQLESDVANWIEANKHQMNNRTVVTIPTVFHVVYKNSAQNIPTSQIESQIQVLNEDYRKANSNFSTTRAIFDTLAADVEIQFCLASKDPQGNPTTGITRTQAPSNASFDPLFGFDNVKSSSTGGVDPWPTNEYLNIWVCDMSILNQTFVLGYAQFPGDNPATDGVVLQYQHVGRTNDPQAAPANLGRTATHEVGHWLGLRHIWGDGPCDSTDYVADTPNASDASQSDCNKNKNTCNTEDPFWGTIDPPDMVENFMDYSADACMTMFTKGQKARMWGFLNTDRAGLLTSTAGCNALSSIKETKVDLKANIYPNPSSGIINLFLLSKSDEDIQVEIYNMLGQKEFYSTVNDLRSSNYQLDLTSLTKGVYLIRLSNSQAEQIQKIQIQ
ncbi:MAG: M43 family zinc metalloprotease [Bacteroidia bacterium]